MHGFLLMLIDAGSDSEKGAELECLSISEAAALARIGRNTLYDEIKAGNLRAVKMGRRTLILKSEWRRYLKSLQPAFAA
jgi:excisionase family DNA binding protein